MTYVERGDCDCKPTHFDCQPLTYNPPILKALDSAEHIVLSVILWCCKLADVNTQKVEAHVRVDTPQGYCVPLSSCSCSSVNIDLAHVLASRLQNNSNSTPFHRLERVLSKCLDTGNMCR